MDINMKINSEKVRDLRNQKGWSQEQLAAFSGLSLRTIQRIEADGNTSRESKVCLAATFDIDLTELNIADISNTNTDQVRAYKADKVTSVLKRSIRVVSIYIFCYFAFLLTAEPSGNAILNGLLTSLIFVVIYYFVDLKLSAKVTAKPG